MNKRVWVHCLVKTRPAPGLKHLGLKDICCFCDDPLAGVCRKHLWLRHLPALREKYSEVLISLLLCLRRYKLDLCVIQKIYAAYLDTEVIYTQCQQVLLSCSHATHKCCKHIKWYVLCPVCLTNAKPVETRLSESVMEHFTLKCVIKRGSI